MTIRGTARCCGTTFPATGRTPKSSVTTPCARTADTRLSRAGIQRGVARSSVEGWLRARLAAGPPGTRGIRARHFLAAEDESPDAIEARASGAFEVIGKTKIKTTRLNDAIRRGADAQAKSQSRWRMSASARSAQDFNGTRLKEYRRIELIAKGSVSDLFLAESARDGNVVALKVTAAIRKESGIDQSMERFLQEFAILRGIQHPNIVRIFDLGVTDDHLYLAMEYFARGDLRKRMSEGLTARQSLGYARDLAYALQAIHEVGIFHRDLKPGNVMLRDDDSIALIDFGLAKHVALKMEVTDKGLIFGTPHYMSPEQGMARKSTVAVTFTASAWCSSKCYRQKTLRRGESHGGAGASRQGADTETV